MPNFKLSLILLLLIAAFGSSCVQQQTSLAAKPEQVVAEGETKVKTALSPTETRVQNSLDAISEKPNEPRNYNSLAIAYVRLARETGDFSINAKAESAVDGALKIDPQNIDALKIKASLMLTFHRFPEALEFTKPLQQKYPNDAMIYGALTDAHIELGNYAEAIKNAQQMVDLRPDMSSYARVSSVRSLHGDDKGAIEAMSLASKTADPSDYEAQAWCLVHLGDEYFKVGRYDEAEKSYDAAIAVFPNYHYALSGKGRARAARGDYETAVKFLTQAKDRVPFTETVISLGDAQIKLGKPDEAQKNYDLAVFIEQKFGDIDKRRLALLWADHDIKLDEALEVARKEHGYRKDIYTADILAWCLYKKGNFQEAKTAITEAMRIKTKDARIYYHAGMIEKALGNKKEAARFLNMALQMSPAFDILQADVAKQNLQDLGKS